MILLFLSLTFSVLFSAAHVWRKPEDWPLIPTVLFIWSGFFARGG